ncbi:MAG: sulfotransferase domain-containing protein [Candidatus Hydrogenedentota bacterium]
MNEASNVWPKKTTEFQNHHFDSTVWNHYKFRDDDIVIGTYAKSGTTWTQQIVSQLIFEGEEGINIGELSPWIDMRIPPIEEKLAAVEAQTHRRFVKTHLPVEALVFSEKAKYVYIVRDGRDTLWSMYHHHSSANEQYYAAINDSPGRVGPPMPRCNKPVREYFREWIENDGSPEWSFWDNIRSWWVIRQFPNVYLLHFANLKTDMPGEMRKLAAFLEIPIDESKWEAIVEHCTFEYMKEHADLTAPLGGVMWEGGAKTFINKGTNGRWRETLTPEDVERYERTAREQLGDECAHWVATGEGLD